MALTKCKGCGAEISKKAKKCPKCGEPQKRTSMFTWLVLILIVVVVASYETENTAPKVETTPNISGVSQGESDKPPSVITFWSVRDSRDGMTGEPRFYAVSEQIYPSKRMDFPYQSVLSSVAVGCDDSGSWSYLYFTMSPNLNNPEAGDGYSDFEVRVKWDDQLGWEKMNQSWGEKTVHFSDPEGVIKKLQLHTILRVELSWHGQGAVYFDYPLKGSTAAISDALARCERI